MQRTTLPSVPARRRAAPVTVAVVTALVAAVAFALGPVLWPPAAATPAPSDGQLPWFVALAAAEALVLGLGVSFALFGGPVVRRLASPRRALAVRAGLVWVLASWWPHDNLHIANGSDLGGLLAIEYGFHLTVMAAGLAVVWALLPVREATERRAPEAAGSAGA
ncbi:MAG: hypothetical protein ACRDK3_09795 [Actinomycetota bacterium]